MYSLTNKNSLLLLLFELGFGIKFHIIGEISLSELFLLAYVPLFVLPKVNWKSAKELRQLTWAYLALFVFQVISEYMVGNVLSNALRGFAITVVSYLHFMFLAYLLVRQKSLILMLVLSQIAMMLFFGTSFEEQSMEDIMEGEAAVYLKFYLAPLTILVFLFASIIFYRHKNLTLLFSALGCLFILLGARNSGGMALAAGLITYILEHRAFIKSRKKQWLSFAIACALGYGFYVYYVNQVLSGVITSGNSRQLFLCENPYNPLELLMAGRSEMWVGWQAFMDKFWFGHGAWPSDPSGKYQRMMYAMHDEMRKLPLDTNYLIPSHSVLVGCGMMNGIFAFLAMAYIVFFFLKRGVLSFVRCEKAYKLVLVYYVFNLLWTTLFSPQSHFRLSMPIAFAIIFVIHASIRTDAHPPKTVQPSQPDDGCIEGR